MKCWSVILPTPVLPGSKPGKPLKETAKDIPKTAFSKEIEPDKALCLSSSIF
jgi:hypothetical protein